MSKTLELPGDWRTHSSIPNWSLFIAASLGVGIFAVAIIPREEEFSSSMLDIALPPCPARSPRPEVEERVTLPIENLVHQSPACNLKTLDSTSAPGQSLVIVRFLVGTPQEDALIRVYSKLYSNFDRFPPGVSAAYQGSPSIHDVRIPARRPRCGVRITTAINCAR